MVNHDKTKHRPQVPTPVCYRHHPGNLSEMAGMPDSASSPHATGDLKFYSSSFLYALFSWFNFLDFVTITQKVPEMLHRESNFWEFSRIEKSQLRNLAGDFVFYN